MSTNYRESVVACLLLVAVGCGNDPARSVSDASVGGDSSVPPPAEAGAGADAAALAPGDAGPDACADLQNDPLHCGTCDHDCQGAICVAGQCGPAPVVIASGQLSRTLAVDAQGLYWINALPTPDGTAGHTQVMRCGLDGCNDAPTILWDGFFGAAFLAAQQGSVWWLAGDGPLGSAIQPRFLSCAVGGCGGGGDAAGAGATALLTDASQTERVAINATQVFLGEGSGTLATCALHGCADAPATLYSDPNGISAMAANAASFFWSDSFGLIWSYPATSAATRALVADISPPALAVDSMVADDQNVYWTEVADPLGYGAVRACPVAGCPAGATTLATYDSWRSGGGIVSDGTDLYFSAAAAGGQYSLIVRCAIGGCGGKPTAIAATRTQGVPYGDASVAIAVDATHVYFTDIGRRKIMMLAK